eukprot:3114863-Prymnesium_polylepis.1
MGAPTLRPAAPTNKVLLPLSADEVQADVHLIYSKAAPAYLATPPLLSCAHAASSIEHYSAVRLQAQGAAQEDTAAHA